MHTGFGSWILLITTMTLAAIAPVRFMAKTKRAKKLGMQFTILPC